MNSLVKNAIFNTIYTSVNLFFPLITSVYISRVLLDSGVGEVSYIQNIVSYFTTISVLGLPVYGTREIARLQKKPDEQNKLFSELFLINFISTSIAVVLYVIMMFVLNIFQIKVMLAAVCGLPILFNYINIDWLYQGLEEYVYISIRSMSVKIISLALIVIFCKCPEDLIIYVLIVSLGTGCNYIFNVVYAKNYVHFVFEELMVIRHIKPLIIFAINIFMVSLYSKVDITMLGIMGSYNNVGYYSYATKIIYSITTVCCAITMVFVPRFAYQYRNDIKEFYRLLKIGIQTVAFFSIPATVLVCALSKDIIVIMFGESFEPASLTLLVLSPMIIIRTFGDLLGYQMIISTGNEKKSILIYLVGALLNIFLNAILIPRMMQEGAAIASLLSELVVKSLQISWMKRIVKYKLEKCCIYQAIIASVAMIVVVELLQFIPFGSYIKTFLQIAIGLCVYFAINYIMKNKMVKLVLTKTQAILNNRNGKIC